MFRAAGRDFGDLDRSAGLAVGRPENRHAANGRGTKVLHGDLHPPLHARGANAFFRLQRRDSQVRPARFVHAVDQADLGVVVVELREAFFQVVGLVPLAGAEIGEQIDNPPLAGVLTEPLADGLEGRQRFGSSLRDFHGIQRAVQSLGEFGIDGLFLKIGIELAIAAAGTREPHKREELRFAGTDDRFTQPLDHLLGLVEGRHTAQILGHRVAVVQEHDMMRRLRGKEVAPAVGQERLRQGQHHQGDGRHPQQQQQQLLENDPGLVLLLARQEELHRRPLDVLVAEHVDQVDQHRRGDEPHSPVKWMNQWKH